MATLAQFEPDADSPTPLPGSGTLMCSRHARCGPAARSVALRVDELERQVLALSLQGASQEAIAAYAYQGVELRARYFEAKDLLADLLHAGH